MNMEYSHLSNSVTMNRHYHSGSSYWNGSYRHIAAHWPTVAVLSKSQPSPCNPCMLVYGSCFRQGMLVTFPGDGMLSIGYRTDRRHD